MLRPTMKVEEVMTPFVHCIPSVATAEEAAAIMHEYNIGTLPICDDDGMIGIITDRDLVTRVLAPGLNPRETQLAEIMTPGLIFVFADQSLRDAAEIMEQMQVRRLPVLSRGQKLVGIVSLTDIARNGQPALGGGALGVISSQGGPSFATTRGTSSSLVGGANGAKPY
ncbi:MAG: CBS domain-containing protein [Opitutaceae bacterium]|nr:CBS domain-containing protein [Opitutaceae bacterium]